METAQDENVVTEISQLDPEEAFERLTDWFQADDEHSAEWRKDARSDFDFPAGRQWKDEDISALQAQNRPVITFNRTLAIVKSICGLEINARHDTVFLPRESDTEEVRVNELLTAGNRWMADGCDAEDEQSEAFQDTVITGMGWCLSGDAKVRLPNTHFATTRLYSGVVIQVDLENGQSLTGTPNHPVLTDSGWKRLSALDEGDNLVTSAFLERIDGFPVQQFDKVEARLEDEVNSFRAGREASWFPTAANDFYADGHGSKVHVVYADRLLSRKLRKAARGQDIKSFRFSRWNLLSKLRAFLFADGVLNHPIFAAEGHLAFNGGHAPSAKLAGVPGASQGITSFTEPLAHRLTFESNDVGNLSGGEFFVNVQSGKFGRGNSGCTASSRTRVFAKSISGLIKAFNNGAWRYVDALANLVSGKPIAEVKPCQFSGIGFSDRSASPGVFSEGVTSGLQSSGNGGLRYSKLIADFFDWKPVLEIKAREFFRAKDSVERPSLTTRIIGRSAKSVHDFPVYDVGTSLGLFIAGNIITSNTEASVDFESEPDGRYVEKRIDPLEMRWDRNSRSKNLADAKRLWRVKSVPLKDAMSMFPGVDPDDLDASGWCTVEEGATDKQKSREQKRKRDENAGHFDAKGMVTLVHAQWVEKEHYYRVAHPQMAPDGLGGVRVVGFEEVELSTEEFADYKAKADEADIKVDFVKQKRPVYKQCVIGAKILGEITDGPCGNAFSWNCITGERDVNKGTWFGVVRTMRDPQQYANKWLSQTLHILNTTAKGGILAEEDAFEDIRDAQKTYAKPDAITVVRKGAISEGKIMQKPGGGIAGPYVQLMEFAISSIRDVPGVSLELLGMRDANQPGILEHQRKQAGLTILATLFDSLRRFRKRVGRVRLHYLQEYFSDGRLVRVAGPDGKKFMRMIKDQMLGKYDVEVDDAPTSPNQREQNWFIIQQMLPVFKDMLTPETVVMLLEFSPLPAQVTEAFKQLASQPKPEAEQRQQLAVRGEMAKIGAVEAQTAKDTASALRDRAAAILDLATAAVKRTEADVNTAEAAQMSRETALDDIMAQLRTVQEDAIQAPVSGLQMPPQVPTSADIAQLLNARALPVQVVNEPQFVDGYGNPIIR